MQSISASQAHAIPPSLHMFAKISQVGYAVTLAELAIPIPNPSANSAFFSFVFINRFPLIHIFANAAIHWVKLNIHYKFISYAKSN